MSDLKHFGNSMFGPDRDVCRECGNEGSTMYFHEGVCKPCRDKSNREIVFTKPFSKIIFLLAFVLGIIEVILNTVTIGLYIKMVKKTFSIRIFTYLANNHG